MQEFILLLEKRRKIAFFAVIVLFFIALIVSYSVEISSPTYFDPQYNMPFTYGLIIYKFIELPILYYLLFHRYKIKLRTNVALDTYFKVLKKHTKLLYFLIPQGNTIFGIIAYKLSGDVIFFMLFSLIAIIALYLVKPQDLSKL